MGREVLGGPPVGPVGVGRPYLRAGRGRESLLVVREWLVNLSGGPGVVVTPTRRSGNGQEAHPKVQKAHLEVREGSGGPPGSLEGPPGCPGGIGRPTQRNRRGR